MSRVYLSVIAAGIVSLLGMQPAAAGCCNSWGGWNTSWGWGNGCCASSVIAVQPVVVQPIIVQPAPVVLQPVIVQPVVPLYVVNQGPVYSGPGTDYAPSVYKPYRPLRAYPHVNGYRKSAYRQRHYGHAPRHPHYYHYKHKRGPVRVYN